MASFESVILKSKFVCTYVCVRDIQVHMHIHVWGPQDNLGHFDGLNEMPPYSEYLVLSW